MRIITLSQLSLAGSSGIAEAKIPLWWGSGGSAVGNNPPSAGMDWVGDGQNAAITTSSSSYVKIFTLSSNWPSYLKYALEISGYISNTGTASYAMWDFTAGAIVSGSTVTTSSTSEIVIRSGQFTLIPSHQYGVTLWTATSSYTTYVTDASLIIFPS